jgi:DNA-binding MarR family transcriptional regulator
MRVKQRFDSIQQESYLSIWRTYDRLKALEDAFFAEWQLTAQQYNVLRILQSNGTPLPTLTIANKLVSRAPDVTRMLDRLEKQSWIVRVRSDTDRRSVLVEITDKGMQLLDSMANGLTELHEKQLGHVTPAELQELCDLLAKVRAPHEPSGSAWG